ncbi:MAG: DUF885 domain-containing protein [Velocimicrobium sp.]
MRLQFKKILYYFSALFLVLNLYGCNQQTNSTTTQQNFDTFVNNVFIEEVQSDSITLNYTLEHPENYNIKNYTPTLGEYSIPYQKEYLAIIENYKKTLQGFSYKNLTVEQQKTYDILMEYLDTALIDEDYLLYNEILGPTTGIQAQLPVLLSEYHIYNIDDLENYLALLSCIDDYFNDIIAFEQEKSDNGLFMSDDTADSIINQCSLFVSSTNDNAMIEVFNDRIDDIDWLNKKEKKLYKKENKERVLQEVIPAYKSLITGLTSLKGSGINEEGLSHFKFGKNYYEYLIRYYTGSSKSIKELRTALEQLIDENILKIQSVVSNNPSVLDDVSNVVFPQTDPSEILSTLKEDIKTDYPTLNEVNYQVKYVHKSLEEYLSPAFYLSPQIDNYNDNCIYLNAYDSYDLSDIFTTLAHEGYPGHLYQNVYFNEQNPYPLRTLLNFSGYSEGWASYAEFNSYDYAGLDSDVAAILKANQIAMICMYADIDLGINYYGWSYNDTKKYLKKFAITNDSSIRRVYAAMIEEPGNYLKYAGGYYEILELEQTAKKIKGNDFDIKKFHEYLLTFGPAPFDVIEKYMKKEF